MSQCVVPNWDVEEGGLDVLRLRPHPTTSNSSGNGLLDVPMLDYEMAELTWENGQLSVHGLGRTKPTTLKGPTAGTLESIVNLATRKPPQQYQYQHQQPPDALVPQQKQEQEQGVGMVTSTPLDSCSSPPDASGDWTNVSASYLTPSGTTLGADSWHVPTTTFDTCETSSGRPATTINDYDSVSNSHQRESGGGSEEQRKRNNGKSASSTRRSRAAAIHNQSERKRRDKINQKMKMLQKLVPNSNKTDKASMLDEVIEYLKQLQGQVNMMNRMSVIPNSMNMNMNMNMMMPLPAQLALQQQQLQMSMMAAAAAASPMGMGMTGVGPMPSMDMNMQGMSLNPMATRQNQLAAPFMGPACWDVADRQLPATTVIDPISTYLACQPQAMTIEAYSRMIALIQQQQQQLASVSKQ